MTAWHCIVFAVCPLPLPDPGLLLLRHMKHAQGGGGFSIFQEHAFRSAAVGVGALNRTIWAEMRRHPKRDMLSLVSRGNQTRQLAHCDRLGGILS